MATTMIAAAVVVQSPAGTACRSRCSLCRVGIQNIPSLHRRRHLRARDKTTDGKEQSSLDGCYVTSLMTPGRHVASARAVPRPHANGLRIKRCAQKPSVAKYGARGQSLRQAQPDGTEGEAEGGSGVGGGHAGGGGGLGGDGGGGGLEQ